MPTQKRGSADGSDDDPAAPRRSLKTPSGISAKHPSHPNSWSMIKDALIALNSRHGSSHAAILSHLERNFFVDTKDKQFRGVFRRVLRDRVDKGDLEKVKASYRLSLEEKHAHIAASPISLTHRTVAESAKRGKMKSQKRNKRVAATTGADARQRNAQISNSKTIKAAGNSVARPIQQSPKKRFMLLPPAAAMRQSPRLAQLRKTH